MIKEMDAVMGEIKRKQSKRQRSSKSLLLASGFDHCLDAIAAGIAKMADAIRAESSAVTVNSHGAAPDQLLKFRPDMEAVFVAKFILKPAKGGELPLRCTEIKFESMEGRAVTPPDASRR